MISPKDKNIVAATIRLWNVQAMQGCIPDYEIVSNNFSLKPEEMREIRSIVQDSGTFKNRGVWEYQKW